MYNENNNFLHSSTMNVFPITVAIVEDLLKKKLVDSAEYWSLLLLKEKNQSPLDYCTRSILYADCLFENEKYEHAQYYYQQSLSMIKSHDQYPNENSVLAKLYFRLYKCEYLSAEDKCNPKILQKCILYLEEIELEYRTVEIRIQLAKLYWSVNNYTKTQEYALSVLQEEPYAIEAIELLSRIRDFRGLKDVNIEAIPQYNNALVSKIAEAELEVFSNPQKESIILFNQIKELFIPCSLFYVKLATCYLSIHQFQSFIRHICQLQLNDPTTLYKPYYYLSTLLSNLHNIPYSHPSLTISSSSIPTYLQQLKQQSPFHQSQVMMECYLTLTNDLLVLEKCYWNHINLYPSYTSYFLLIQFYINENLHQKALVLAKQLQQNNKDSLYANLLLARVYISISSGKSQAEVYLRKCLEMDPHHTETVYLLAKLLYDKTKYKEAIEILSNVVGPNATDEIKSLLCNCYFKNGDSIPYLELLHTQ